MTLTSLIIGIGIFALVLTSLEKFLEQKLIKNYLLSLLQNLVGGLFIFSGIVKVVDPLGTAYKMEQYFAEFESTFAGTKAAFLAPMFPTFAEYAVAFSVFMIVFEIALGLALLFGTAKKFTAWAFFLLVLFFTFLTGFTYLTGFVPEGVNFFQFGQWGEYVETNMKVTDCGCFGDFLKLEPRVSFLKDVFLLIPGLIFLFTTKSFHTLEKSGWRALAVSLIMLASIGAIYFTGYTVGWRILILLLALIGVQFLSANLAMGASTLAILLFCFSNYVTDIPQTDFRPFREGANIAERKALEEEAEGNVKVLFYEMSNKGSGEVVTLPFDEYLARYQEFPSEEWDLEQIKSEPEVARTKISDFEVSDLEGYDITEEILGYEDLSLMIVAYKLYGTESRSIETVQDSLFATDTLITDNGTELVPRFLRMQDREVETIEYSWDEDYTEKWIDAMLPLAQAAHEAGIKVYAITAYSEPGRIEDFRNTIGASFPIYMADDILLKTIVRSNPGLVIMRGGQVLEKQHRKKLPDFESLQATYLQ